jgi:hypothetical protein
MGYGTPQAALVPRVGALDLALKHRICIEDFRIHFLVARAIDGA